MANRRSTSWTKACRTNCFTANEVVGFCHAGWGRMVIFTTMLFLSTALLLLASASAGCEPNDVNPNALCDKTMQGGLRPSSLMALINMCGSFAAAALMPLLGAVVDRTPYRRTFALWACYLLLAVNLAQGAVGPSTWIVVAGLSVFSTLFFLALQTAQLAYLPELSRDHAEVSRVAGKARAIELLGVCVLVAVTMAMSALVQKLSGAFYDSGVAGSAGGSAGGSAADLEVAVLRARVGQVCGVLMAAPSLLFAWHMCLGDRAPAALRLSAAADGKGDVGRGCGGTDNDDDDDNNDDDTTDTSDAYQHHEHDNNRRRSGSSSGSDKFATASPVSSGDAAAALAIAAVTGSGSGVGSISGGYTGGGSHHHHHHSCLGLWSIGVRALANTCRRLSTTYPMVLWYLLAFAFWEAANSSLVALSTSFLIFELGFSSQQVIPFLLIAIVFAIPAAAISGRITSRFGVRRALLACLIFSVVNFSLFSLLVQTMPLALFFGALFGVQNGWISPLQRFAFATIIPGGQEAELFGVFAFAGQVVGWVPPLIFILANESGNNEAGRLRRAMLAPLFCYATGLAVLYATVDFSKAVEAVLPTLKLRAGPAFDNEAKVLPADFIGIELPKPIDAGDVMISARTESGGEETEGDDSSRSATDEVV